MNMELITACLAIMLKGMLGIFIVILVIWGLVALLGKLTAEKAGVTTPAKSAAPAAEKTEANQEVLLAAASAALAEDLGTDVAGLRIISFKKC